MGSVLQESSNSTNATKFGLRRGLALDTSLSFGHMKRSDCPTLDPLAHHQSDFRLLAMSEAVLETLQRPLYHSEVMVQLPTVAFSHLQRMLASALGLLDTRRLPPGLQRQVSSVPDYAVEVQ